MGARHGDTFHEVMISLPVGSYGMAVDLPGALWGRRSSADSLQKAAEDLRARGYVIDIIIGDSTSPRIVQQVLDKGPFGAALLDGDHTYEGISKDWENYHKCAELVALHDIVGEGMRERVHGHAVEVPKFWKEVKRRNKKTVEFIEDGSNMGIGVWSSQ